MLDVARIAIALVVGLVAGGIVWFALGFFAKRSAPEEAAADSSEPDDGEDA